MGGMRGERGQAALEYVLLLVFVGGVVLALSASDVVSTASRTVATAVCRLFDGDCSAAAPVAGPSETRGLNDPRVVQAGFDPLNPIDQPEIECTSPGGLGPGLEFCRFGSPLDDGPGDVVEPPLPPVYPPPVEPEAGERNWRQDKKLSSWEIRRLQAAGFDIEELKEDLGCRPSRCDLFRDEQGNIYVKPKGGRGPGEETGLNINDYP